MTTMTYLEAGKAALAEEMRRDPRVWALGENLGRGGVFGQYRGLAEEFGPARIVDAPCLRAAAGGPATDGCRGHRLRGRIVDAMIGLRRHAFRMPGIATILRSCQPLLECQAVYPGEFLWQAIRLRTTVTNILAVSAMAALL